MPPGRPTGSLPSRRGGIEFYPGAYPAEGIYKICRVGALGGYPAADTNTNAPPCLPGRPCCSSLLPVCRLPPAYPAGR